MINNHDKVGFEGLLGCPILDSMLLVMVIMILLGYNRLGKSDQVEPSKLSQFLYTSGNCIPLYLRKYQNIQKSIF